MGGGGLNQGPYGMGGGGLNQGPYGTVEAGNGGFGQQQPPPPLELPRAPSTALLAPDRDSKVTVCHVVGSQFWVHEEMNRVQLYDGFFITFRAT